MPDSVASRRIGRRIALAMLTGLVGSSLYFIAAYPGLAREVSAELRLASFLEIKSHYKFLRYYAAFYQELRLNPDNGIYDFDVAAEKYAARPRRNELALGKLAFHQGDFSAAISHLETDIEAKGESEKKLFWLAMAHQRRAEAQGCLPHLSGKDHEDPHPDGGRPPLPSFCSLPITPAGERLTDWQAAAEHLEKLLQEYGEENQLYRWLLNFSYMAMGRFPDGVPAEYRIDNDFIDHFYGKRRAAAEARFDSLSFRDRARELGVAVNDAGKGVAVEDFDGDGWMDLFVARPFTRMALLHNEGIGADGRIKFTDVTHTRGLLDGISEENTGVYSCVSSWDDVDNDGDLDLFVAQFGQRIPRTKGLLARDFMSSRLYINDGERFHDRTAEYGLARVVEDRAFIGAAFSARPRARNAPAT